jgi:ubiquinone/menaquinone biosynthesis C-methylase UbiE
MSQHAALIRRYFDAAARDYARSREREYSFGAQASSALALLPRRMRRVLDLGCGTASLAPLLLERAEELWGVDLSPEMIAQGGRFLEAQALARRCHLALGDATALAFADGFFDAVVSLGMLEYLPSMEPALAEIARVLAPGGTAVLAMPNFAGAYHRARRFTNLARSTVKQLLGRPPLVSDRLVRARWLPQAVDAKLARAGLAGLERRYCNFILHPLHELQPAASLAVNRWLTAHAPRSLAPWLGAQYVVKALKPA